MMTMTEDQERLEDEVRRACDRRDYDGAATVFLQHYGSEIAGYLAAQLRNPADAGDAFSDFCEDFWKGLPRFEWRCSVRGWGYMLARHAGIRLARSPRRKRERNLALSQHPELSAMADRARTATAIHLRTDAKSKIRALRERLSEEEQTLLILRVDRGLSWDDLAVVLAGEGSLDVGATKREAARLRQRFKKAKDKLKAMARKEGLL